MQTKSLLLAIAALSLNAYAVDTPGSSPAEPSVRDRMSSARKALESHDYRKALAELKTVVNRDPRNAEAQSLLGYSYRKLPSPDLTRAFEHYNLALKSDPRHKGAHEYIGEAYLETGDLASAERHLETLKDLCPLSCEQLEDLKRQVVAFREKKAVAPKR